MGTAVVIGEKLNTIKTIMRFIVKIQDKVKVINGNNEVGQPTMIGKVGVISSFGSKYKVKGKDTVEVYVDFKYFGTHIFNDYHLKTKKFMKKNKTKYSKEVYIQINFTLKKQLTKKNHKEFIKRYLEVMKDFEKKQGYEFMNWENNVEKLEIDGSDDIEASYRCCLTEYTITTFKCDKEGEILDSEYPEYNKFLDGLQKYFYKKDEFYKITCHDDGWDGEIFMDGMDI